MCSKDIEVVYAKPYQSEQISPITKRQVMMNTKQSLDTRKTSSITSSSLRPKSIVEPVVKLTKLKNPPVIQLSLGGGGTAFSGISKIQSAPKTPERHSFPDGHLHSRVDSSINRDTQAREETTPKKMKSDKKKTSPIPSPRSPYMTTHENLNFSHHHLASAA